jgi:hypothetical protein
MGLGLGVTEAGMDVTDTYCILQLQAVLFLCKGNEKWNLSQANKEAASNCGVCVRNAGDN